MTDNARWWEIRRAHNRKPATYTCPLCGRYLPALGEHMLMFPEGDRGRRRHAHTDCVMAARRVGRLPSKGEWVRSQRQPAGGRRTAAQGFWRKAIARLTRGAG